MPTYEFHCKECGYYFDVKATVKEKEEGLKINCEQCGSDNLQQVFGGFFYSWWTNSKRQISRFPKQ